jgi:predicted RNase H-like HicB family nuclease
MPLDVVLQDAQGHTLDRVLRNAEGAFEHHLPAGTATPPAKPAAAPP